MTAVIVDTEYTTWPGALESGWSAPDQHREIVQIAAIAVDDAFREIRSLDLLVRPAVNPQLSDLFVELTGITQSDVDARGGRFGTQLARFLRFVGEDPIVCMNGDGGVFAENGRLNDEAIPDLRWHRLRPFLEAQGIDLGRLSSGDLHTLTPHPLAGHTHNALHDVRSMAAWLAHAKRTGVFADLAQLPTDIPTVDPRSDAGRTG